MGFTEIFKALFLPALIAAALYMLLAFLIVPLIKRHRERYSQYLPLDSIQRQTNGVRDRFGNFVMRMVMPRRQAVVDADVEGQRSGSGEDFAAEDGERMVGFDVEGSGRR
ncbi:uncharacterized protein MYCFIDRAFT_210651 [Pseudocercospora fijiensis CIRAD86]|uniref:Uncharacterized protein n=1 Tax=Pseudocercospora fijiensis (strain CIRAD86) TaxID=383855 RepID=M3A794_PSEFD|nr:uncharacterized protein MYCFIDRAFT_210651 [Pseudocercospora fijiensis CIRAD86]EME86959.1 hypothetical protein MYCFIDRAFT_210651 [Pseudocercospora fijiensis CIRAD86]